jgi:AraC-like DNA-binding protein
MMIDISQVKTFVASNLNSVRKTQQVAEQLHCSLEKLKKTFYRSEKLTLSRYIRESKVLKIKEQLLESRAPCKVICLNLGLREDVGARLFKNTTGMTMEEFRKSYRDIPREMWKNNEYKPHEHRSGLRLVITEKVVHDAISSGLKQEPKSAPKRTDGSWIQGPAS